MSDTVATEVAWYLSYNGKTVGPFSSEQVVSHMLAQKIPQESMACPDGGEAWRPLHQWPAFRDVALQVFPNASHYPPVPDQRPKRKFMEWVFLVYGFGLNPLLLLFAVLATFGFTSDADASTPFGVAERWAFVTVVIARTLPRAWMIVATVQLAQRRVDWAKLMSKGMVGYLLASCVFLPLLASILAITSGIQAQAAVGSTANANGAGVIFVFSLPEIIAVSAGLIYLRLVRSDALSEGKGDRYGR